MLREQSARVGVVLKGYPRLSETFIAQEILALERHGLDVLIISLRHPTDGRTHPVHAEIRAPVHYLPEYLYRGPLRVLRAWWRLRRSPAYKRVFSLWLRDLRRDPTPSRIRGLVTRIIDERVQEGQLDQCGLTLQELAKIREAFIPVLTAIFHVRAPYPEDPRKRARSDAETRRES